MSPEHDSPAKPEGRTGVPIMKTQITIRKNAQTSTGYELVNGDGTVLAIESTYKGEPNTLVLPKNTANRQYCNSKKVDAAPNYELTLDYKESQHFGTTTTRKSWEEYLSDDDKLILEELKTRAEANKKAEQERIIKEKNDPIAKARRELERAQAKVDALMKKAAE